MAKVVEVCGAAKEGGSRFGNTQNVMPQFGDLGKPSPLWQLLAVFLLSNVATFDSVKMSRTSPKCCKAAGCPRVKPLKLLRDS
jgi:hypothetical protein